MTSLDSPNVAASVARQCAAVEQATFLARGFMENEVGFLKCFESKNNVLCVSFAPLTKCIQVLVKHT